MKSEYRVAQYDSKDVAVIVPVAGAPAADIRFKPTIQTVSTSLVYRFNTDGVAAPVSAPFYTKALAAPVSNWTGFYVGGGGGYGMSTADSATMLFGVQNGVSVRTGGRGAFGTVSGGYDQQFNRSWVAGIFADAQFGNINATIAPPSTGTAGTTKNNLNYAAGVRVGYLVAPNVLSYVNGGYSHADFKGADLAILNSGNVMASVGKSHYDGWFLGGGVENSLNIFGVSAPGWFMKTEYRVAEYNRKNIDIFDPSGAPTPLAVAFKPYVQTVSSSLVYRFNWGR
jgi:outer membrane immunogenic protein